MGWWSNVQRTLWLPGAKQRQGESIARRSQRSRSKIWVIWMACLPEKSTNRTARQTAPGIARLRSKTIRHRVLSRPSQKTVCPNLGPQAAAALQGVFCAGGEGCVHPVAGAAFFGAIKANALNLKLHPDQFIQTSAAGDYISTKCFRTSIPNPKLQAEIVICFCLEERDLAFVTLFVAKEPVPGDPFSGQALNFCHFDDRVVIGRSLVMTKVIVPRRNEQMKYLKLNAKHA